MKIPLSQIAHTRSGDKGDTCNVGVIANRESDYPVLVREVEAVQGLAVDVHLPLVRGAVADAHRPRAAVALPMLERILHEVRRPVDPVHRAAAVD